MKRKQTGINLVDSSIALAIITLLLGAVIKGPEIIDNAKVKNLATDFKNIPLFLNSYHSMYKTYPGDDATIGSANSHLLNGATCSPAPAAGYCVPGDGMIEGNWNDTTAASESYVFWQHIRLAGLVSGSTTIGAPDYLPENGVGSTMGIQSGTSDITKTPINEPTGTNPIRGAFVVCSQGIKGKLAKQLDITLDDGNTGSGMMMAGIPTAAGTPMIAVAALDDSTLYTVCMGM